MDPEKVRRLAEQAEHLSALSATPSWPVLRELLERRVNAHVKGFCAPGEKSTQDLDHTRGFICGLRYVIEMVEGGPKQLEKAIQQAQALEEAVSS